jgi:hypothetical protein
VPLAVTLDTERDEVVQLIVAQLASLGDMMHLQEVRGPAILTSPAISVEHEITQAAIRI